jgi:hypothetical protein
MRITVFAVFLALAGCASQPRQASSSASFDGQNMPKVGQTKQEVESVWGKPDRSRLNSDGSSAELFVPDKMEIRGSVLRDGSPRACVGGQVWARQSSYLLATQ